MLGKASKTEEGGEGKKEQSAARALTNSMSCHAVRTTSRFLKLTD